MRKVKMISHLLWNSFFFLLKSNVRFYRRLRVSKWGYNIFCGKHFLHQSKWENVDSKPIYFFKSKIFFNQTIFVAYICIWYYTLRKSWWWNANVLICNRKFVSHIYSMCGDMEQIHSRWKLERNWEFRCISRRKWNKTKTFLFK